MGRLHDTLIDPLLAYWSNYCHLNETHQQWLLNHRKAMDIRRSSRLFEPGDRGDYLYFVCSGLLATVWWDTLGNRRIDRLLPPAHSVLTRNHLYARSRADHEVIALRRSTVICIPADPLRMYKESCPEADTLVDVMEQKRLKQYQKKSRLMLVTNEVARYHAFAADAYMKPFRMITSHQEQADYLGISRRTVTRAIRQL
jgi:cAMP-binding proteins - catabolite gene activator and regulatory subunit of cAMP-dependent protein kinases